MGVTESTPLPPLAPGETVQDAIAAQTRTFYAEKGVDLSGYTTDEITRLHQYNVFPEHVDARQRRPADGADGTPGPDPRHRRTGDVLHVAAATRHAAYQPIDLAMTAEQATLGLVLDQDLTVLDRIQRGLHSPGFTHLTLSNEERRIINTHRNLERYLDLPESERITGG